MRQITAPHSGLLFGMRHVEYSPPDGDSEFLVPDLQSRF